MTRIGVIAALPAEARTLSARTLQPGQIHQFGPHTLLSLSGIGAAAAGRASERLLQAGCDALLSWGTAAGLDPALGAGSIVLAQTVISADGKLLQCDEAWRQRLDRVLAGAGVTPISGNLAEAGRVLESIADKQALATATGAIAVDMESAAIARLAIRGHIPWMAIRAVVDGATSAIPASISANLDEHGRIRILRLLAALLREPLLLAALWRLQRDFSAALRSLRRVARTAGPVFAYR